MTAALLAPETAGIIQNIYCVGRNYAEHAAELNNPLPTEPVLFHKSLSALRGMNEAGVIAFPEESFHHEAEVVVMVGADVTTAGSCTWDVISHIGLGLDLTRRSVQTTLKEKGLPWERAKSFRGAAIVSPLIPKKDFGATDGITFSFSLNGVLKQSGNTSMMLYDVPTVLSALVALQPLRKGDLVFTGTPKGVGPMQAGDRFVLAFEGRGFSFEGVL